MSSTSSDDLDREVDTELDGMLENMFEDMYTNLVEPRAKKNKKRAYIERRREVGHISLWNDYFSDSPTYNDNQFWRRFRMNKSLFMHIVEALAAHFPFFQQRRDAVGRSGLSTLQKCTAAVRILAYGCAAYAVDEYLRLGESTVLSCLDNFTDALIGLFGDEYLRRPISDDLRRLLDYGEARGFLGMKGSIDCMHWEWKNCPTAWKRQYTRGSGKPTIVLEAVASYDLWIWHAFFGSPGTLNDINILDRSSVFDDIIQGQAPSVNFTVNNHHYDLAYYLADDIYPKWATFIQSISLLQGEKAELFAKHQEAVRKRAFGVLQARFRIVRNPALSWDKHKIAKIMRTCVILHNMIVEDERGSYSLLDISAFKDGDSTRSSQVDMSFSSQMPSNLTSVLTARLHMRDRRIHEYLKSDLVENIWVKFGNQD